MALRLASVSLLVESSTTAAITSPLTGRLYVDLKGQLEIIAVPGPAVLFAEHSDAWL